MNGDKYIHYMIFLNGTFVKNAYGFSEVVEYLDRNFLYGKITYKKIA